MSRLPLLATKIRPRSSHFLLQSTAAAILALFLLWSPDSRASVSNQFIRLTPYPTGGTPAKIVTADFNRDGKEDLVVLNSNGVLSLLLGNGAGAFAAPKTIATLPSSSASSAKILAADFNGDGNPDVLLLAPPGNAVKVFRGHGDGTFAAAVTIADGLSAAGGLAIGDFNNDGRPDVAITGATSISVLLGNGSGIFEKPIVTATSLSAAPAALILALGDVNRDSHLDAAVTDGNGNLQILLGNGNGRFRLRPVSGFNTSDPPSAFVIADFNGDGKPDIAAEVIIVPQFAAPYVVFLAGQGDGTFEPSSMPSIEAPDRFAEIVVTNLNGKPGLTFPSDPLIVYVNNGSGVLSQTTYAAGGGPVALADFNGDGRQDIAAGSTAGVEVLLNVGGGTIRAPLSIWHAGITAQFTSAMNTTDFNRDGYADLVVDDFYDDHGFFVSSAVVWLGGQRNRFTQKGSNITGYASSIPPAIGDFNHDGFLDVADAIVVDDVDGVPSQIEGVVLFGDGKGGLPTRAPAFSLTSNYLAAGNYNADGFADLTSVNGSELQVLMGKGDGTFAVPVNYAVGSNPVFVLKQDLNRDGKNDLIVVNHDSDNISILLGNGDGTFKTQKTYSAGTLPNAAVTGDFNRDGKIDIAVASNAGVLVLLGNGDGTFRPETTLTATGPLTGIAQASLRQDGIESLLGVDSASKRFMLLPGVGDGTFKAPVFYPVDRVPSAILAADFDGDGATDIALLTHTNGTDGTVAVFYNQGGDHVALSSSSSKPTANQSVTLTAHVTAGVGEPGTPTGKITFKDGTRILGTVDMSHGAASLGTHFASGSHGIVALYSGDTNFNPNHSSTLTIAVGP